MEISNGEFTEDHLVLEMDFSANLSIITLHKQHHNQCIGILHR